MNRDADNKKEKFHFVELFLVAADVNRTYVASMLTKYDDEGHEFVTASVKIVEGEVISAAPTRVKLENNLDAICILKLDYNIHEQLSITSEIISTQYFHN